jgi:hypothetical protein
MRLEVWLYELRSFLLCMKMVSSCRPLSDQADIHDNTELQLRFIEKISAVIVERNSANYKVARIYELQPVPHEHTYTRGWR